MKIENQNAGWRLRILRQSHGLTLHNVSDISGLDVSYLSRLERGAIQNAKPKMDTIERVLDAIDATLEEREAVLHVERPLLKQAEIDEQVRQMAALDEDNPLGIALIDEHWYLYYYNRAARAALGVSQGEYPKLVGDHMLLFLIDESRLRYTRVAEEDRRESFAVRAEMFRRNFAAEQFDTWYTHIVDKIHTVDWAAEAWDNPRRDGAGRMIEHQTMKVLNPICGTLEFELQMNHLLDNRRFLQCSWTPANEHTASLVAELRERPEFRYSVDGLAHGDESHDPGRSTYSLNTVNLPGQ